MHQTWGCLSVQWRPASCLQARYSQHEKKFADENIKLTEEYKRITEHFKDLQAKFSHFQQADLNKFQEVGCLCELTLHSCTALDSRCSVLISKKCCMSCAKEAAPSFSKSAVALEHAQAITLPDGADLDNEAGAGAGGGQEAAAG